MDAYGQLYEVDDTGSAVELDTANTYVAWVGGALAKGSKNITDSSGTFVIGERGDYIARFMAIGVVTQADAVVEAAVHVDGTEQTHVSARAVEESTALLTRTMVGEGILEGLAAGAVVDLRFKSDTASDDFTVTRCYLVLQKLSD